MKMLPMLNNLLPRHPYASNVDGYFAAAYQTMLIHISTDSKYNGWYMFPIKEKNILESAVSTCKEIIFN